VNKRLIGMVLVVAMVGLVAIQGFGYDIQVRSLLLPGINQACRGQWVEATTFFALDAMGIYLMTQTDLQMSDLNGNVWTVKYYVPLYAGVALYGISGLLSTEYSNCKDGVWAPFINVSVKW